MTKRILIIGGSGFIGTNAVEYYSRRPDCAVVNFDIATPMSAAHQAHWWPCDLMDVTKLCSLTTRFDPHYIIHLAARTDLLGQSVDDYKVNTVGVRNLISVLPALESLSRVLFTSSMLVCGIGHNPRNQDDYCPTTAYGRSKVIGEQIVRDALLPCEWAIIRPTSIWGPWFKEPYRNFFEYIIAGRYFHIGSKPVHKTYGYIGNSIHQMDSILHSNAAQVQGRVFYIGDSDYYDIRKWADEIGAKVGVSIRRVPFSAIWLGAKLGDVLKALGISFPMSTFRLRNMTTNNLLDLSETTRIAPSLPYSRADGIDETLRWLKSTAASNSEVHVKNS